MGNLFQLYRSHYKALLHLGIPIVIGQIGIIILGFADTLMIGRHSAAELGAAGFVNNVFALAVVASVGFSYGLTPLVGELFGRGKQAEIGNKLRNSLWANFFVAILLTAGMFVFYLNVERMNQPAELIPLIKPYFLTILFSIPFMLLFNGFKQFADGITDTRTSMWILLGGNVLNIVGNYLLIYGVGPFPELGLLGAGLSTLFSRILMLLIFVGVFFYTRKYQIYREGFDKGRLNKKDFIRLNTIGWPVALQMGMETASFSLCAIMVGWLGTMALATHQIVVTISTVFFMMYMGMGSAIAVRVSYFKGQNDLINVRRSAMAGFHLILCLAVCCSLAVWSFRYQLGGWFTENGEVSALVVTLILPLLLYQFGDGLQIAFSNALRGISDVKPVMIIAFFAYFLLSLPVSYLFGFVFDWGLQGIWMSYPVGLTTAGLLFLWRFHRQTKRPFGRCQRPIHPH